MYEFDWSQPAVSEGDPLRLKPARTSLPRDHVEATALLYWQEHCLECAMPDCYQSCGLYSPRPDGHCGRLAFGIVPNRGFSGLFDHGADLRFRRWAKLESKLFGRSSSTRTHRLVDRVDRALIAAAVAGARFERTRPRSVPRRVLPALRRRLYPRVLGPVPRPRYDDFVLECHSPNAAPLRLILELSGADGVWYRHAFAIEPGPNFHAVPVSAMNLGEDWTGRKISIFPENDAECRLIFTWLDFVKYSPDGRTTRRASTSPSQHVKCVAWDLDGTLWRGTLVESGPDGLEPRAEAVSLIRALDARGILQTIVSKNDHDAAWRQVESLGLADYFLCPAINWGQKSQSLKQIAERLNIGLDSFALIDDSAFERAEVTAALPQVRTYPEGQIPEILELPEFDVAVTELSRRRRGTYRANAERDLAAEGFGGDYENFLRSCAMKLRIFTPNESGDRERCFELVQRSNQLNLSTHRYTADEFDRLLSSDDSLCLALHCEDRFGDYGIIGFASVAEEPDSATLSEFVLSCRAAQKRVEHSFLQWLADRERARGRQLIRARLTRTDRNGPLLRVFDETPFECVRRDADTRILELRVDQPVVRRLIMDVKDEVGG